MSNPAPGEQDADPEAAPTQEDPEVQHVGQSQVVASREKPSGQVSVWLQWSPPASPHEGPAAQQVAQSQVGPIDVNPSGQELGVVLHSACSPASSPQGCGGRLLQHGSQSQVIPMDRVPAGQEAPPCAHWSPPIAPQDGPG